MEDHKTTPDNVEVGIFLTIVLMFSLGIVSGMWYLGEWFNRGTLFYLFVGGWFSIIGLISFVMLILFVWEGWENEDEKEQKKQ